MKSTARVAIATVLGLAGIQLGVRLGVSPHADAWNLFVVDGDGAAVWASLVVSDTGILDDQLTTRLVVLPANGTLVEHRAQWGPAEVDEHGVHGADRLEAEGDAWSLRVGGDGLGARLTLAGKPGCPPSPGRVGGMIEDRTDGRLVDGVGVVVRERLDGHAEGVALYALDTGFALGIDPWSGCPAWVVDGARRWTGDVVAIPDARRESLQLGDWTLTLRGVGDPVTHDEWEHVLPPERAVAALFGFAAPVTELRRVLLEISGPGGDRIVPGLRVERL